MLDRFQTDRSYRHNYKKQVLYFCKPCTSVTKY